MASVEQHQAILEERFAPIAQGESNGVTYVVYRAHDGRSYAFYRRTSVELVDYCATLVELLTVIRAHAPAGALAEMAPGIFLKAM